MPEYNLISFNLCPFVQRSVITLREKGVPYEIEYIDLAEKPDWFLKLSPLGKVPVLRVGDEAIFESAVINEYIDETAGAPLHPRDPLLRAKNRAWIEFLSGCMAELYQMSMAPDENKCRKFAGELHHKLDRVEEVFVGPFFNGDALSLVDTTAAPMLQRLAFCEEVADLGGLEGLPHMAAWHKRLLERDSVKGSTVPNIRELYREYLQGRGSPSRDTEPSWLGTQVP